MKTPRLLLAMVWLAAAARPAAADVWDQQTVNDDGPSTRNELTHGSDQLHDLATHGVADEDFYRLRQNPRSSYEVVVDSLSGTLAGGLTVDLVAADGTTIVSSSVPIGVGSARTLRIVNAGAATVDDQRVRVRALACGLTCGPDDVYRIRFYETTYSLPRFNNSGSQLTVLILQNPTESSAAGQILFWGASGALLGQFPLAAAGHSTLVVNTSTIAGVSGQSGTITVVHDAAYGALVGKAVALEPSTGFSFDTPMVARPATAPAPTLQTVERCASAFEVPGNGLDDDCDGQVDEVAVCDAGLLSNSSDAMQYAAAMDLCQTTTETGSGWGVISASLTLASGTGTPATVSRAIRGGFGSANFPRTGAAMVVLSTGTAASPGQTNPAHTPFEPGSNLGTQSGVPADWLAANGGNVPHAPNCPSPGGSTANDPVMLTIRIRVPTNARSLSFGANFFGADYAEFVCSAFTDVFVALLDSRIGGSANPADKNLAIYEAPGVGTYPVGVNLAFGNTGLFTQCVNGTTGCGGGTLGTTNTCTSTLGLAGTGFDVGTPGSCNANSLRGGGTGWLVVRGNVAPGEIIDLRLAIWDTGDSISDSLVLLDDFRWSTRAVTPGASLN